MLLKYLYKLWDLLIVKSTEVIPDLEFKLYPGFLDDLLKFFKGIGFFLDLEVLGGLFLIWLTYHMIRIAVALRKGGKQL